MNLFERLKEERERLGYSQTAFASLVESSKHAQINWEKGVASPNATALAAWAGVGLDVLYVVTGDRSFVPPKKLTSEEETMLEYFREASPQARKAAVRELLSAAQSKAPPGSRSQTINAPVVGNVTGGSVSISNKVKNNR